MNAQATSGAPRRRGQQRPITDWTDQTSQFLYVGRKFDFPINQDVFHGKVCEEDTRRVQQIAEFVIEFVSVTWRLPVCRSSDSSDWLFAMVGSICFGNTRPKRWLYDVEKSWNEQQHKCVGQTIAYIIELHFAGLLYEECILIFV
jgi:hypothetical protein